MLHRRISLFALTAVAALPLGLAGQTPAASSATLPIAGVFYRYWPEQIVQWVGPELPYSMIVLDVDDRGKEPVYDVELVPKTPGAPAHYTNSADELTLDQRAGFTVHLVKMRLDGPAAPSNGAQYLLRFNTETGTPVVWQFVLGTDVTEQGAGASAIAAGPASLLMDREQGGLAGQGTALQIGNVTSTADVWKEIAQPPYFVPYRGALSVDVHVLTFAPVEASWKADGSSLTDAKGEVLSVAKNADGVVMTDNALGTTATYDAAGGAVSRVLFAPAGDKHAHGLTLQFSPALTSGEKSTFEIIAGKKTKVAAGTVEASAAGPGVVAETWTFTAPDELRGRSVHATNQTQP
ncbi:MAG TPA: hypothetical protein VHZ09_12495 [Acidobacteriaceae bacterium]|jgi:hypothetical protein|nr:hypothetical protein [Acidobacteriaceae bacterium]